MNEHSIREATIGDAAAIMELIVEHASYEGECFEAAGKLEKLKSCLSLAPCPFTCLVVETAEGIDGYCIFMPQLDSWYGEYYMLLDALYLRQSLRGMSVGLQLMTIVQSEAELMGCHSVRVMTPSHNDGAIAFYEKLGGERSDKAFFWFKV